LWQHKMLIEFLFLFYKMISQPPTYPSFHASLSVNLLSPLTNIALA
jgi:hypothetical protein